MLPGLLISFRDDPGADDVAQQSHEFCAHRAASAIPVVPCYKSGAHLLADTQQLTYRVIGEMPGAT